jgi:hypothetical protein
MAEEVRIAFDQNRCTFNEMVEFEELTGFPMADLNESNIRRGVVLRAIVYLMMRRTDPNITIEEAGEFDIGAVDFVDPTEAEPTPLKPLDKPAKTRRAKAS